MVEQNSRILTETRRLYFEKNLLGEIETDECSYHMLHNSDVIMLGPICFLRCTEHKKAYVNSSYKMLACR
jgi:hypothetical protein